MPNRSDPILAHAPADHLAFLRAHAPFDALDDAALACVLAAAELIFLPRGERVLTQGGDPARHMYLIRKGAVRLERDGQTAIVLEEGDLFGFPSLTSGEPPAFDVVTAEDTLAYRIAENPCAGLLQGSVWTEFLVQGLQERLRRTAVQRGSGAGDLTESVAALVQGPAVWLPPTDTVRAGATVMRDRGISSVLVTGDPPGIVTDRDLRSRVLANGIGPDATLDRVATRPLKSLPDDAPVHEAVGFMLRHQVHHLPVTRNGEIVGVVTNGDLLRHRSQSPLHLGRRLARLDSPAAAEGYADEVAATVERLFDQGVDALRIGRVIAGLNDTLVRGALRLAESELGPPPRPYEWMVFGSEGRLEQTLLTDQDNALAWDDTAPESSSADPATYFRDLARHVVATLLRAGFPRCAGGYMATRWAMPLSRWQDRFRGWTQLEEADALVDAANFFDFRGVRGVLPLDTLSDLLDRAGQDRIFLAHLAADANRFRPPLGLFGRLKDHHGAIDLKREGIMPIVGLARVYALVAGSHARATATRLAEAAEAGVLSHTDAETLSEAFALMIRLRLRAQLEHRRSGQAPTNALAVDELSTLERRHLKEAFLVVRDAQDVLAQRFHAGRLP